MAINRDLYKSMAPLSLGIGSLGICFYRFKLLCSYLSALSVALMCRFQCCSPSQHPRLVNKVPSLQQGMESCAPSCLQTVVCSKYAWKGSDTEGSVETVSVALIISKQRFRLERSATVRLPFRHRKISLMAWKCVSFISYVQLEYRYSYMQDGSLVHNSSAPHQSL
jgi:hypothetical protein